MGSQAVPTPTDVVEALLFASDTPLEAERIREVLDLPDVHEAGRLIEELRARYEASSQGLQIVLVSLLIGAVLVALGMITVSPALTTSWTGAPVHHLVSIHLLGRTLVLTEQLLRVAGFLAAFSALYVTVSAVTDEAYRAEFYDDLAAELRQALAVRAVYLATLTRHPAGHSESYASAK